VSEFNQECRVDGDRHGQAGRRWCAVHGDLYLARGLADQDALNDLGAGRNYEQETAPVLLHARKMPRQRAEPPGVPGRQLWQRLLRRAEARKWYHLDVPTAFVRCGAAWFMHGTITGSLWAGGDRRGGSATYEDH
jgi:hypothetical protein